MSPRYRVLQGASEVTADTGADGEVTVDGRRFQVAETTPGRYLVTGDDARSTVVVVAGAPHETWAVADGHVYTLVVDSSPKRTGAARAAATDMTAPMPATVVSVVVAVGERVTTGAPVVVLEAMKMELTVRATYDGVVGAIHCSIGDLVTPGVRLVEIEA
ncbi:MAG: hypothetical protein KA371_06325 [Acidobacteria bacterium]|nr:hypothetical protein [Acidobacteriota bacterium]